MLKRIVALVVCALALGVTTAYSQDTTGSIVGHVTDSTGAAVKGATVTVMDAERNVVVRTVTTGDEGEYSVTPLPVGNYSVTIEAPSFKKSVQTGVKVDVGQRRTSDASMEVGDVSEVVTVEAAPIAIELTTPSVSTVVTGAQARELSVNNRNFVQLVTLAPGVTNDLADQVYVGTTNPAGQANTINISVNGARSSQNTFTVDGADITDRGSNLTIQTYPSIDSISEFKVLRSLYPAESGGSGGGQVNIVTRSGTDAFHGVLYEFVRNERLNANDFLTNSLVNPPFGRDPSNGKARRAPFRYNNYGFTIGGPVYLPNFGEGSYRGYFKRMKRTFFFFSEEQRKDIRYVTLTSSVPDANLRQGIFPIPVCLTYNAAGTTCTEVLPANTPLPANRVNSAARAYLDNIYNKLPLPNQANFGLVSAARNVSDFRQEILKLDHSFSDNWSANYRYEADKIPTLDANSLFSSGGSLAGVSTTETDSPGRTHTLQTAYTLSSNAVLEGRYTHAYGAILSHNVGLLALQNFGSNPVRLAFPNTRDRVTSISGNGFGALTSFGPYDNFSTKDEWGSSLSYVLGGHTLKFGGEYSRYRKNENALIGDATGANQGLFNAFNATLPAGVAATGVNPNLQRWANFLVGNAQTFVQGSADYTADFRQSNIEAYVQDEWRFRNNLTIYYGVRYSRFGQPSDKNGRLSNFIPSLYNPADAPRVTGAGNRVAGSGNFCNGMIVNAQNLQTLGDCRPAVSPWGDKIVPTSDKDFAPRVGLAWDPFGTGKTSIRTGYGIYHEQVLAGFAEQIIGTNPPYLQNLTVSNTSLSNPVSDPTIPVSAAASTIRAIDPEWHTPYMQHWSLDWQQQLARDTVLSVGYYGSKGTHLIGITEINEIPPGLAINSRCVTGTNTRQTPGAPTVQCQVPGTAFTSSAGTNILDQLRPYQGYRSITMLQPRYNSNYHSLQFQATSRFSRDSQLQVAYTWSKNLTDEQNDRTNAPQNSFDIRSEYSRAALDRRHVFTLNYIYELPFYRDQKGFAGKLLGGWETTSIITAQSGLPFTVVTSSFDASGLGNVTALVAGNRPNVVCDPNANAPHSLEAWFNTACFQLNPPTNATNVSNTPGNSPRGVVNGPPTYRVDFSLFKNFRFGENLSLQLRGEAFNVFNHTNFRSFVGVPNSLNVTSVNFGRIGTVRDPRTIQLGAKFYF
ncbi:MAG TPA: carboxypeptidase regulatory-like domain-containing protein [Pyrinomonadaceae bacterium]|nr:carboxypeptidase regulatory-like domain-containing protein [Pyrinomonadaceae bacterium]